MAESQNTKYIPLGKDRFAIVDESDYEWLTQWKWHCAARGYATRNTLLSDKLNQSTRMHRVILDAPDNMGVDHINNNPLDNRRCNLRLCSQQQNLWNQKKTRGSSKYRGVCWDKEKEKWAFLFVKNGVKIARGRCGAEIEAAKKWNELAKEHYGEFAWLNEVPND